MRSLFSIILSMLMVAAAPAAIAQGHHHHRVVHHRVIRHHRVRGVTSCNYYDPTRHAWVSKPNCVPRSADVYVGPGQVYLSHKRPRAALPKPSKAPQCSMASKHDDMSWQDYYHCYQ